MLALLQPLFAALIGAALSFLGSWQMLQWFPAPVIWHQVVLVAPQLFTVGLFTLCLAVTVTGVVMFTLGLRSSKRRLFQVRHVRWAAVPAGEFGPGEPDEPRW